MLRAVPVLAASLAIAVSATAQNLLDNPDFDLPPVGNGWTQVGAGDVTQYMGDGEPAPSLELVADGSEFVSLRQCKPVSDAEVYDVEARSYTSFSSGLSTNAVRVRWYALEGCSDELGSVELTDAVYPPGEFSRRYRYDVHPPIDAQSARVELEVVANGTYTQVRFDAVYLPEPTATSAALIACAGLLVRRRIR